MSYLISLNPMLFKNVAHVGSFTHFDLCVSVFVYLCICLFVYLFILHLIHRNVIFYILESHAFQKNHMFGLLSTLHMLVPFTFTLESEEFEKFEKSGCCRGSLLDQEKH